MDIVEDASLSPPAKKEEPKKDDIWGFWGSSKKTSGISGSKTKKEEIKSKEAANESASLSDPKGDPKKALEPASAPALADEPAAASATPAGRAMSASKTATKASKSSIQDRIAALDKANAKSKSRKDVPSSPPPPPEEPLIETVEEEIAPLPSKKEKVSSKSKSASLSKSSSKKKDLSPPPVEEPKESRESFVPGSFPEEPEPEVADAPAPTTDKKSAKKSKKSEKPVKMDPVVQAPMPPSPPTPPPEASPAKTAKKERATVVRADGAASWGFWGAAPKKDVKKPSKAKDDADPVPEKKPAIGRSKSTRTPREMEKASSKSSGSDKDKRAESRPKASRGMSFSGFFMGGPPPVRSKSVKRSGTTTPRGTTSRRQSVNLEDSGMLSPPPDDAPEFSSKAAKLMGTGPPKMSRRQSTKGKERGNFVRPSLRTRAKPSPAAVPDPYPIDDDDMVMINAPDPEEAPKTKAPAKGSRKEASSRSKSKREVGSKPIIHPPQDEAEDPFTQRPSWETSGFVKITTNGKTKYKQPRAKPDTQDDIVMVDPAGPSGDAEVVTGPDDLNFVEAPREAPPLKRSATSAAKKTDNKIMGLFGFGKTRRASETLVERPKTTRTETSKRALDTEDDERRLRREKRKVRRSVKADADVEGGFTTDAPGNAGGVTDAEDMEARRNERRAKRAALAEEREADIRAQEERRARRREAEKIQAEARKSKAREIRDRRIREEEEREARRTEEKRARRAAREERQAQEDAEAAAARAERHEKRRPRDLEPEDELTPLPNGDGPSSKSRLKTERRRSHMDKPIVDEDSSRRHRRTTERRSSHRTAGDKSSRRRSAPPVDDYFDSRNGVQGAGGEPVYANANPGSDKTSSWVANQLNDPPEIPPIEPTVIDAPPNANKGHGLDDYNEDEEQRKDVRKLRRHRDKGGPPQTDGEGGADGDRRRRRRREGEKKSSEGSEKDSRRREREKEPVRDSSGYGQFAGVGGGVKLGTGEKVYSAREAGATPGAGAGSRNSWFKKFI